MKTAEFDMQEEMRKMKELVGETEAILFESQAVEQITGFSASLNALLGQIRHVNQRVLEIRAALPVTHVATERDLRNTDEWLASVITWIEFAIRDLARDDKKAAEEAKRT